MNLRGLFQDFNPRWGAAGSALGRRTGAKLQGEAGHLQPRAPAWASLPVRETLWENSWSRPRPASSSRARCLQSSGLWHNLDSRGQEPRSWRALSYCCPNVPLSVPAFRTPLPAPYSPHKGHFTCPHTPIPQVISAFEVSLEVSPFLPCLLLCGADIWNVESLESVSGYGNTLHNAFGGEAYSFPYGFFHTFTISLFAGSRYCCPISQWGNNSGQYGANTG